MTTRITLPPVTSGDEFTFLVRYWGDLAKTDELDKTGTEFICQMRLPLATAEPVDGTIDVVSDGVRRVTFDTTDQATGLWHIDFQQSDPVKTPWKAVIYVAPDTSE